MTNIPTSPPDKDDATQFTRLITHEIPVDDDHSITLQMIIKYTLVSEVFSAPILDDNRKAADLKNSQKVVDLIVSKPYYNDEITDASKNQPIYTISIEMKVLNFSDTPNVFQMVSISNMTLKDLTLKNVETDASDFLKLIDDKDKDKVFKKIEMNKAFSKVIPAGSKMFTQLIVSPSKGGENKSYSLNDMKKG